MQLPELGRSDLEDVLRALDERLERPVDAVLFGGTVAAIVSGTVTTGSSAPSCRV